MCKHCDVCPVCKTESLNDGAILNENCKKEEPDYSQCIPMLIEAYDWNHDEPYNPEIYNH